MPDYFLGLISGTSMDGVDAVYRVGQESGQGTVWAGVPETPLALSRWIPELGTYLDAIRPWLDLHLS